MTNKPRVWVPGDWNAFFGFGTNILVKLIVLTGLLRFVIKMPDELAFGRILPATGLMMFLSTMNVIDRQLHKAALSAAIGGALTFFGFMHGEAIGVGKTPVVALAYMTVAGLLLACAKLAPATALEPEPEHEGHGLPEPAE